MRSQRGRKSAFRTRTGDVLKRGSSGERSGDGAALGRGLKLLSICGCRSRERRRPDDAVSEGDADDGAGDPASGTRSPAGCWVLLPCAVPAEARRPATGLANGTSLLVTAFVNIINVNDTLQPHEWTWRRFFSRSGQRLHGFGSYRHHYPRPDNLEVSDARVQQHDKSCQQWAKGCPRR